MGICQTNGRPVSPNGITQGTPQFPRKNLSAACVDNKGQGQYRSVVISGLPEICFDFVDNQEEYAWWRKIDDLLGGQKCIKRKILPSRDGSLVLFIFSQKATQATLDMLTDNVSKLVEEETQRQEVNFRPMAEYELNDSKRLFSDVYIKLLEDEFEDKKDDIDIITNFLRRDVTIGSVYSHFCNLDKDFIPVEEQRKFMYAIVANVFQNCSGTSRVIFSEEEIDEIVEEWRINILLKDVHGKFTPMEFKKFCKWCQPNWSNLIVKFRDEKIDFDHQY